jgi:hypothetical protein
MRQPKRQRRLSGTRFLRAHMTNLLELISQDLGKLLKWDTLLPTDNCVIEKPNWTLLLLVKVRESVIANIKCLY